MATAIVRRLHAAGFAAFWVGGCVRDFLLGRPAQDYDIATDARPEDVERIFPRTIPVGKKFGVIIVMEGEEQFQVATFRAEADYQDGRRPGVVTFANAEADAQRRDFTINGLFYDPDTQTIHDWVGGQADLAQRLIRTIGDPEERFAEDHLRLLRAIRFAARLDFQIAPETWQAVQQLASRISVISAERIRDELLKLFRPPHAARGLVLLRDSGLLIHVFPELAATITCEQSPDYHPEGSVFNHIQLMLEKLPAEASDSLAWSVLLHDIAKPVTAEKDPVTGSVHFYGHEKKGAEMAEIILERLRFPRRQIEEIVMCVRCHMQFKDVQQMRQATLRRLLLRPTFPLELDLHRLDCLGSSGNLQHYEFLQSARAALAEKPALIAPLVNGDDLIALGVKPGKEIGNWLQIIRDKQLQEELKTPAEARDWLSMNLRERVRAETRRRGEEET
jgi:poly(A) polymerase